METRTPLVSPVHDRRMVVPSTSARGALPAAVTTSSCVPTPVSRQRNRSMQWNSPAKGGQGQGHE